MLLLSILYEGILTHNRPKLLLHRRPPRIPEAANVAVEVAAIVSQWVAVIREIMGTNTVINHLLTTRETSLLLMTSVV
jgi:hypothetical protein